VRKQSANYMSLGIAGTSVGFSFLQVADRVMFLVYYNANEGRLMKCSRDLSYLFCTKMLKITLGLCAYQSSCDYRSFIAYFYDIHGAFQSCCHVTRPYFVCSP